MAVSETAQALIAAFFFGILVNTASAGFVLCIKGHGSAIFRDGQRLALISFLAFSALWAQVQFLSTLIDPTATSTCHAAVVVSSLFDQFARVSIEQFLIWSMTGDGMRSAAGIGTQLLLLARFIIGMVFVGEAKPQFNNTCVPLSSVVPIAIAVIALDAVILTCTAVLAFTTGSSKDGPHSKAFLLTISALAIWMGTSVTMLLGLDTLDLSFRTTLPAVGLFILTALVTILSGTLATPRGGHDKQPDSPTPQSLNRDLNFSAPNSQNTTRDLALSTPDLYGYPPSRYEEVKSVAGMTVTPFPMPKFPPRDDATGLPTITRPVTGVAGVGGVPVQGQLFPPIRANTADQASTLQGEVRTRIDLPQRSKTAPVTKAAKGKLVISAPIPINDPEAQNAFDKIPTVDLATAAKNEQERREGYARRVSALIANRPAPKPPGSSGSGSISTTTAASTEQEATMKESSVEIERSNSLKTTQTGALSVEANASTTSVQLSPGNEELRRRSPRQAIPAVLPARTPTKLTNFQPVTPGQPFRIPIPRAPPPPEVLTKVPEPVKTPLQRRPTIGLPSNPRAHAMKTLAAESKSGQPQTVMFINEITYDDPAYVKDIIQEASKTPFTPLRSSDSVLHRPRPIPRQKEKDRQVFPAEVSTSYGHRRSKSGGHIIDRRSLLPSQPSSPKQLPPLPPPPPVPQSASLVERPQPNDTKSMTFDEKMSMFYTGPPSASSTGSGAAMDRRRSSVPELPPLPPMLIPSAAAPPQKQAPYLDARLTTTTATDRTSYQTQDLLGVDDSNDKYMQESNQGVADRPTDTDATTRLTLDGNKRQSSPVIPTIRFSNMTGASEAVTHDDTTTNWGSIHSPGIPVNVLSARLNARSTWIKKDSRLESVLSGFGDEVMTVMLDTSSEHSTTNRQSFFFADEGRNSIPSVPVLEQRGSGQWHRRVGDDCPTFSTRKDRRNSRKVLPPTPLLLNTASTRKSIIIHTAEPSPMESPNAAYNLIQAQLRKLDEPSRDSIASEGRRLALLEDLELEMGQQESRWQTMQHNLDRDSISTLQTDSRPVSVVSPVLNSNNRTSVLASALAERRASRRALMNASRSKEDLAESGVGASEEPLNAFQTRFAAAQMEYSDNAPQQFKRQNSLNFFTMSEADLGSPTPPDTDDESDSELFSRFESLNAKMQNHPMMHIHYLWEPSPPARNKIAESSLWEFPLQEVPSPISEQLPGLSIRPFARKNLTPLAIHSTQLWQKPQQAVPPKVGSSLWKGAQPKESLERQESSKPQKARPLTQRPPRRSRRATLLPDILESPEPLPDKRGTLGIFQFPWGERSENATFQPRSTQAFMAMPGTMASGGPRIDAALDIRSRQFQADEYSSSFFDDYDEDDDAGDNFDDDFDDSGDDFDENTLWEIASLLNTNVPSKNSLLPPQFSPSVIDEYITEAPEEDEIDNNRKTLDAGSEVMAALPTPLKSTSEAARSLLWTTEARDTLSRKTVGLPQPGEDAWMSYITTESDIARPRAHLADLPQLESSLLWAHPSQKDLVMPTLWVPDSKSNKYARLLGLPQPSLPIWQMYLSPNEAVIRKQARLEEVLLEIQSTSLWSLKRKNPGLLSSQLWEPPTLETQAVQTIVPAKIPVAKAPSPAPLATLEQRQRRSFMWTMPSTISEGSYDGLFDTNVVRRDYRRTSKAPIAAAVSTKPRAIKEPLLILAAQNLWKRAPRLESRTTGKRQTLWSPTSVRVAGLASLFRVDPERKHYRTTDAEPAALNMISKPRKSNAPLPHLSTFQFWQIDSKPKVEVNWIKISSASRSSSTALFRVDPDRKHYRTTNTQPAALNMVSKPRKSNAALPRLSTFQLWQEGSKSKAEINWLEVCSSFRHMSNEHVPTGAELFKLDADRRDWRTTSAAPAALNMTTRSRSIEVTLPQLESTRLWTPSRTTAVELDWITMSTIRPQSPSVASIASTSSAPSSPVTDASSIRTASTRASTVAPSIAASVSSVFSLRSVFGRKKKPSPEIPEEPESALPGIPETTDEPIAMQSSHEKSKTAVPEISEDIDMPFIIRNLDEELGAISEPLLIKNLDEKPAKAPTPRQQRPSLVHAQEWDAALQEAIKASHIPIKIVRRTASPKEWSMALADALAASYPSNRFSRGQALPSDWDEQLCAAIARSQRAVFDVSKRHPVFFGSMTTTAADVHPAMFGMVAHVPSSDNTAAKHELLWSKAISTVPSTAGAMWSSSQVLSLPSLASRFSEDDQPSPVRKPSQRNAAAELPIAVGFSTQTMWKRDDSQIKVHDWLDDTMKKNFSRVELRY